MAIPGVSHLFVDTNILVFATDTAGRRRIQQEQTEGTEKEMKSSVTCALVEGKAVENIVPIHKAKLMSYVKLLDIPIGLLINFHEMKVTDGVSRLILPRANL